MHVNDCAGEGEGRELILAIDPGASGGIAYVDKDGTVRAENMPDGMTAQADRLRELALQLGFPRTILEKTGTHFPGNNASASVKFGRHCGHLEAICYCYNLPVEQITAGTWMRIFGKLPKEKKDRKNIIKDQMQRRYPHLNVTLKTADALGILTWGMK